MFYDLKDKKPKNSGENWVAPNATIIGDVTLEKNSSIWFNAVLRGDIENIHIGLITQRLEKIVSLVQKLLLLKIK